MNEAVSLSIGRLGREATSTCFLLLAAYHLRACAGGAVNLLEVIEFVAERASAECA